MKKILVVDDDPIMRENLTMALEMEGYEVFEAEDGKEGISMVFEYDYDCIISDIEMPNISGIEFLKEVRVIKKLIPVIMLTGVKSLDTAVLSMKLGAQDYLVKPLDLSELGLSVKRALELKELRVQNQQLAKENRIYQKNLESLVSLRTKQLEEAVFGSLAILAQSVELKDPYTRGHSERVKAISLDIAQCMGLSAEEKEFLSYGALLHDIGKIGIKDDVLLKNGKLTDEEYEYIMSHPQKGADLVSEIKFFQPVIGCIRYHHEKWDGTGYPSKLKGEEIPLMARIIAVADTFDAMTTTRPYRKALSKEKALEILKKISFSQLDGKIVDIFIENRLYEIDYVERTKNKLIVKNSGDIKSLLNNSNYDIDINPKVGKFILSSDFNIVD